LYPWIFHQGSALVSIEAMLVALHLERSVRRCGRQITRSQIPWKRLPHPAFSVLGLVLILTSQLFGATPRRLAGKVVDPDSGPVAAATVKIKSSTGVPVQQTKTDDHGNFAFDDLDPGQYRLTAEHPSFVAVSLEMAVANGGQREVILQFHQLASVQQAITVIGSAPSLSPEAAPIIVLHDQVLDANPGRPGAPISIPGVPIETASGGIKAPQYFAPGVAGDHGEPIAQYLAVGSYLVPNNLSANAHGNGYADPNIFVPQVIENVQVDGGAFNVREGNHSVNLAATYGLRSALDPFVTITGDYRDSDLVAGLSPTPESWLAIEASYGNGLLDRLEHRQQYKFNGQRVFHAGDHLLTLFGLGYYGFSFVPGLVPLFPLNSADANFPNYGDTIDPRQKDQTHTALAALNDVWRLDKNQQLQLSGFFRSYNLSLYSDFGQGLIRQSEFRTVAGGSANYINNVSEYFSLLAGFDYEREAPRRDDLDQYGFFNPTAPSYYGPFTPIDGNNITIQLLTPYLAAQGKIVHYLRYYLGWRRDEIDINNDDLLHAQNSFQKWTGVNSPKGTISFLPKASWYAPLVSFSFGQAFFTEDPRVGTGSSAGSPVATSRSYQVVASKTLQKTDLRLTLGHVTSSAELAKIDPDTGLQFNLGPSRLRFLTISARRNFSRGFLLATFSKADARDLDTGEPTPEAPRTIFDLLGTAQRLPFQLQAQGEFEYVGVKPLGTGCLPVISSECTGTAVKEFRGAVLRSFSNGVSFGLNFLIAAGYSGQTTENFCQQTSSAAACDPSPIQEVVGVRIPSYAGITLSYRFGRKAVP
jgi:Carboxypeptidase regulatory-like domain